jgi:hypothetical protein
MMMMIDGGDGSGEDKDKDSDDVTKLLPLLLVLS